MSNRLRLLRSLKGQIVTRIRLSNCCYTLQQEGLGKSVNFRAFCRGKINLLMDQNKLRNNLSTSTIKKLRYRFSF
jgi:hypothetical protein